jgi:integrase
MLTAVAIRALKPGPKAYKVGDSQGLFLLVQPSGALLWRLKYRFRGVEKKLSLGRFPETSLKKARARRDEARVQLEQGIDPAAERQAALIQTKASAANTFSLVADEYVAKMEQERKAPATIKKARWFRDLLEPDIGHRPISEISPHELLTALKRVERRGHHETAQRLRAFSGRIFRYAAATLRADKNPADVIRGALIAPTVVHHAAILEPLKVGELLRAIDDYPGKPETRVALQIAPHVFFRPGELRQARWSEVDLESQVWRIPADRTKSREQHIAPLSRQVLSLLQRLREFRNPGEFLFPALHTSLRSISENTLNVALRRLGYGAEEMTAHGFRAIASTLLNESGLWHPDAIERALAHKDRDQVRAAYHRGAHWAERVKMAQWWSDHLDQLRQGAVVIRPAFGKRVG